MDNELVKCLVERVFYDHSKVGKEFSHFLTIFQH